MNRAYFKLLMNLLIRSSVHGMGVFFLLREKEDDIKAPILQKDPEKRENYTRVPLDPDHADNQNEPVARCCRCSSSRLGTESAPLQPGSRRSMDPKILHPGTPAPSRSFGPPSSSPTSTPGSAAYADPAWDRPAQWFRRTTSTGKASALRANLLQVDAEHIL
jgi:hypothetical protein